MMTIQAAESETERIEREAREWMIYLYSDEAGESGRNAFVDWLNVLPDHAKVFRALEQASRDLTLVDAIHPFEGANNRRRGASTGRFRRFTLAVSGVFAACISLGLVLAATDFFAPEPHKAIEFASPIGEVNQFGLPDGSVVTLDSGSTIEVTFNDTERRVDLLSGRAFFDVEADADRSFFVDSEFGRVIVTGTRFDVWREDGFDFVGVTEGQVQIASFGTSEGPQTNAVLATLGAAESLSIMPDRSVSAIEVYDPESSQQWRDGRLVFIDEELGVILEAVNRYRETPIEVVDEEILDLRLTIGLQTNALDDFYEGIEAVLPVSVSHMGAFTYLYADD